ncbi:YcxB family protein [Aliiroseovarius sp. S253]|uniref:YcxB family protein n=1 Tax=Aliiroseovarius sp. S253 TaxID=3415133 RepID=UPI003C7EB886
MSTNLEFYSRFDAIDIDFAMRTLAAERRRRAKGWGGQVRSTILIAAFVCISAIVAFASDASVWTFLSFMLLMGAGLLVVRHSRISYRKTLSRSRMREGVARIVLSPLGMRITHPGYEVLISWSHMEGVLVTERGLLLLIDAYDYCPIERSAFNNDAQMQEVADQIEAWRAASGLDTAVTDA